MFSKLFYYLSKKASRKNLEVFILKSLRKAGLKKKEHKVLNIGAGGDVEKFIRLYFNNVYSIDNDEKRKPDQLLDLCDEKFPEKINYKPTIICCFEVLEHTHNPLKAIENIFSILEKGDTVLVSVPFNFHIHDEPYDYYRFTYYGLKMLFKNFSIITIKKRNGWLESIFVNIIRLEKENNLLSRMCGRLFLLLYYLLLPIILIFQKIFSSDKLTTGYFVEAIK
tara:strand:- start:4849 stop:5517 length:669 start_codon:yes stop_codon:yes gene_type:complete